MFKEPTMLPSIPRALCAIAVAFLAHHSAYASATTDAFDNAMQAYADSHYDTAFTQLGALADQGHAESARIALMMARFGPVLYAARWSVDAQRKARWLELAGNPEPTRVADSSK
jgi:hypothetical protein